MRYFKLCIAILAVAYLSGCSSLKGGAVGLFNQYTENNADYSAIERVDLVKLLDPSNHGCDNLTKGSCVSNEDTPSLNVERLERAFIGFYNKKYDGTPQPTPEDRRNRVQDRIIAASNESCKRFQYALKSHSSTTNFVLGTVTTGLGAAGAIATQSTAQILAAGAGFTSGTRAEYNQDFFSTLAVEVIVKAFEQVRSKTLETIEDKRTFKLGLTGQGISNNKSISLYTVQMAVADAITYHAQCSLTVGLEEASRSLTLIANPGAEQLRQAMGIVDQLRQQQATGGRDISLGEGSNLQSLLSAYANNTRKNNENISSDLSKIYASLEKYKKYTTEDNWNGFNKRYNELDLDYYRYTNITLINHIESFEKNSDNSYSYRNENEIIAKHSTATKSYLDATAQKDVLIAYEDIVKVRAQAIKLRLEIDDEKRKADELVKIFGNKLQELLKEIEDSATNPVLSITFVPAEAKVTESVTFTAVLTGNANAYRDGNNTIKWQQNSSVDPQPDDKGWTDINEASGQTYKRTVEAGDASKTFRAVALDKAAGSKDLLTSKPATLSLTP